jgi:transcription elongation factor GreA
MSDYVVMTRDAYNRKKTQVEQMEQEQMPKIAEKIATARAEGDLKENAEYHAQREAQGMLQARINKIKSELVNASIVDMSTIPKDQVGFGATVKVMDLDLDDEEEITLVGAGDEDYDTGKYNIATPIGQGLLGKKVGDKVEIEVPKGTINFEVLEIRYEEL